MEGVDFAAEGLATLRPAGPRDSPVKRRAAIRVAGGVDSGQLRWENSAASKS